MGLGHGHTAKLHGKAEAEKEEAYCTAIVEALLAALPQGLDRLRTVAKFAEDKGAKAHRLVELQQKYARRVAQAREEEEEEGEEEEEREGGAGEFVETLRRVGLSIGRLLAEGGGGTEVAPAAGAAAPSKVCSETAFLLRSKLHEQGVSLCDILESLSQYAKGLEGSSEGERQEVIGMMQQLALSWGLEGGSSAAEMGGGGK
jgi:hypothetical protein